MTSNETDSEHASPSRRELARELTARYAYALDDGNWSDLKDLFAEDAVLLVAGGEIRGRDAIATWYQEYVEASMPGWAGRHFIMNHRFAAETEQGLEMLCYFLYTFRGPSESIIGWGKYEILAGFAEGRVEIAQLKIAVDSQSDVRQGWVL